MPKQTVISTLYVSETTGNDCNNGLCLQKSPFKSLEKALETVRVLRAEGQEQAVTIRICDPVYHVDQPIVIDKDISALTIEPAGKTLLTGGVEIKNFKKDVFYGTACFSADLSAYGDLMVSDFYINGKRAEKSRFPKTGTLTPKAVENNDPALGARSRWFIVGDEDLEIIRSFKNPEEWTVSFNHYWIDEHSPVRSFDTETGKVSLRYSTMFTVSSAHPKSAMQYYLENVAEVFGAPNEWYYDKKSKKLYYVSEEENASVESLIGYIPVTEQILVIRGTEKQKVQDVTIRNFDIAHTTGNFVALMDVTGLPIALPEGVEGFASAPQSVCSANGAIELSHAYNCAIENCHLSCLGLYAIDIKEGVSKTRIVRNQLLRIGAGGIKLLGGKCNSPLSLHTYGNTISDNAILHCGQYYQAGCGILLRHAYENTIAHNEIGYTYYTGISCGWVWGYADSISHHNLIEKNHIHHIGQGALSDMGGIYLLGKQTGTVIRNNLIHDVQSKVYGGFGIYPDEGSRYLLIENNICYNTSDAPFHQHYGKMNMVRNNIFLSDHDSPIHYSRREEHVGVILERNIMTTPGLPAYRMGYVNMAEGPGYLEDSTYSNREIISKYNVLFDTKRDVTSLISTDKREYSIKEAQIRFGIDEGSVSEDPRFSVSGGVCFTLTPNSPAYTLGFRPIDIADVGPRFS